MKIRSTMPPTLSLCPPFSVYSPVQLYQVFWVTFWSSKKKQSLLGSYDDETFLTEVRSPLWGLEIQWPEGPKILVSSNFVTLYQSLTYQQTNLPTCNWAWHYSAQACLIIFHNCILLTFPITQLYSVWQLLTHKYQPSSIGGTHSLLARLLGPQHCCIALSEDCSISNNQLISKNTLY